MVGVTLLLFVRLFIPEFYFDFQKMGALKTFFVFSVKIRNIASIYWLILAVRA